jgi:hypothetical protein
VIFKQLLAVAGLACCLAACTNTYKYGDQSFKSRDAAMAAVQADLQRTLAAVSPVPSRVGGKALVVVPTRQVIEDYGVPSGMLVDPEAYGYIADVLETSFLSMADIVRQGKVFDSVALTRASDTANEPSKGYDYKLWVINKGPQVWQWYMGKTDLDTAQIIGMDRTATARVERADSFNTSVVKAAAALGARLAVGPVGAGRS